MRARELSILRQRAAIRRTRTGLRREEPEPRRDFGGRTDLREFRAGPGRAGGDPLRKFSIVVMHIFGRRLDPAFDQIGERRRRGRIEVRSLNRRVDPDRGIRL